ncbi:MAG: 23S rRNA (pseudouridine(1915)-N(3))-methyltransferase RlmH [Clostridia bacterium]|nr:23S rRNA (pseudouridine(1915)-N(3))-methyltransferase RlmH [Clostridia bacterium]
MNITILCVGRMKEKPYRQMADEYRKRLTRFGKIEEIEVPDLAEPDKAGGELEARVKEREGEQLLARIRPTDYVIALTIPGKRRDSEGFSRHLADLAVHGRSSVVFVIGGSLGLSQAVLSRADEEMSMSDMTFPHQLARVMLYEQVYRAMKIQAGERYHK